MFVLHGTSYENCVSILKNKKINHISKTGMLSDESPNQIFMSFIYKNIKNQLENMPFCGGYCFVFSPEILKKYPFYANQIGSFSETFEEGMSKKEPEKYASGSGNLKIMPKLSNLKKEIDDYMQYDMGGTTFMHSHEILIGNDIPLNKYCLGLVIRTNNPEEFENSKEYKNLMKLTKNFDIFLIIFPWSNQKSFNIGLDGFIDIVNNFIK
jgi:hypothetical protein